MPHGHMKQASTLLWWSLRITRKTHETPGLNREGTKQNKNILTKNGLPIRVGREGQTMPLKFIDLNSPPVVAVNCDNQKAMGKDKWHRTRFNKSMKNDNRIQEEKMT